MLKISFILTVMITVGSLGCAYAEQIRPVLTSTPVTPWQAPPSGFMVKEDGSHVTVIHEAASLRFSKKRCGLDEVLILGTSLGNIPFPNLSYTDEKDEAYHQDKATDGKLHVSEDDAYALVEGMFHPLSQTGKRGRAVQVSYKIRKEDGLMVVTYRLLADSKRPIRIRKLTISNTISQLERNKIDRLEYGLGISPSGDWLGWNFSYCGPEENKIYEKGARAGFAIYSNGRVGLGIEPVNFKGASIAPGYEGYLTLETKDRNQLARFTYINQPRGSEMLLKLPYSITYLLSPLPFRLYSKPNYVFYSGPEEPRRLAMIGVDTVEDQGLGLYPFDCDRVKSYQKVIRNYNRYGLKVMFYIDTVVNGTCGWAKAYHGIEMVEKDRFIQGNEEPEPLKEMPELSEMCMNASLWENILFNTACEAVELFNIEGIRTDNAAPGMCRNIKHGCSRQYSSLALSHAYFYERLRKYLAKKGKANGKDYIITGNGAASWAPSKSSLLDCAFPGEAGGWSDLGFDLVYNSILPGIDCIYFAQPGKEGHPRCDTPEIYEKALARCAVVFLNLDAFKRKDVLLWMKYMNPLKIFDVNNSRLYHPLIYGYHRVVRSTGKNIIAIIYARPEELLLVLANEGSKESAFGLSINLRELGISSSEILIYDTFSDVTREVETRGGILKKKIKSPPPHDAKILLIKAKPAHPEVIWHDVVTREVSLRWMSDALTLKLKGISGCSSNVKIYCEDYGEPNNINGGQLASYVRKDKLATIRVNYNEEGIALLNLDFARPEGRVEEKISEDLTSEHKEIKMLLAKIIEGDYTQQDRDRLDKSINNLRKFSSLIEDKERRRKILTYASDCERTLLVYTLFEKEFLTR